MKKPVGSLRASILKGFLPYVFGIRPLYGNRYDWREYHTGNDKHGQSPHGYRCIFRLPEPYQRYDESYKKQNVCHICDVYYYTANIHIISDISKYFGNYFKVAPASISSFLTCAAISSVYPYSILRLASPITPNTTRL